MCGVCMDAAFHGGSNDIIGGRGRLRRPEISPIYPLQLSPILGSLIAGVVVTADNWSPVSTINLSPVSTTPAITENPLQGLIAGVVDTGDYFFAGVVDTAEQFFAGVVDTGDKH
jgi:hypothetical protein